MSETEATGDGRPWALCRTVGAYSGGTRVEIIERGNDQFSDKAITVRVIANDEVIHVRSDDLVKLRSATDMVRA